MEKEEGQEEGKDGEGGRKKRKISSSTAKLVIHLFKNPQRPPGPQNNWILNTLKLLPQDFLVSMFFIL